MISEEPRKRLTLTMPMDLYKRMLYLKEKYSDRYRSVNDFGVEAISVHVTNYEQGTRYPEETLLRLLDQPEIQKKIRAVMNKLE